MNAKLLFTFLILFVGSYSIANLNHSCINHERIGLFPTIEPGIKRFYSVNEFRICTTDVSVEAMQKYLKSVTDSLKFNHIDSTNAVITFFNKSSIDNQYDLEGIVRAKEGGIHVYYWRKPRLLTVTIECHTEVEVTSLKDITKKFFGLIESTKLTLEQDDLKKENNKLEVRNEQSLGSGVFATKDIKKGELIGGIYGIFFEASDAMSLPDKYRDHVMQCGEYFWRGTRSNQEAIQFVNHSCDPNCGARGLFDFIAMRDIKAGEQITTDYAMQDDSNWEVPGGECLCGVKNCRGKILPYADLTQEEKDTYKDYISHWILHKYSLCSCQK